MKPCELLNQNLFAYAEKELPAALMQQLDRHVSGCATCNRLLTEFKSVMALMEEQKSTEPRPFAETRLLQGIETRLEKRRETLEAQFSAMEELISSLNSTGDYLTSFFEDYSSS